MRFTHHITHHLRREEEAYEVERTERSGIVLLCLRELEQTHVEIANLEEDEVYAQAVRCREWDVEPRCATRCAMRCIDPLAWIFGSSDYTRSFSIWPLDNSFNALPIWRCAAVMGLQACVGFAWLVHSFARCVSGRYS